MPACSAVSGAEEMGGVKASSLVPGGGRTAGKNSHLVEKWYRSSKGLQSLFSARESAASAQDSNCGVAWGQGESRQGPPCMPATSHPPLSRWLYLLLHRGKELLPLLRGGVECTAACALAPGFSHLPRLSSLPSLSPPPRFRPLPNNAQLSSPPAPTPQTT